MIEFKLKNRRLRLYPDGVITCRAIHRGKETIKETWNNISFNDNGIGYLVVTIYVDGAPRNFYKHRLLHLARNPGWDIFDTSPNNIIDHINHNRRDNTSDNLRVVTTQQNQFNREVKGYSWHMGLGKWIARIKINNKLIHIGYYDNEEEAHAAYLKAKEELHIIN